MTTSRTTPELDTVPRYETEVLHEWVPIANGKVHGVTFDGASIWFCADDKLVAIDPESGEIRRTLEVPSASAGTAFDGRHLYQLAKGEIKVIRPDDGRVVRTLPAPGKGEDSGMAWADGYLYVGQFRSSKIHKVDATTGEVVKTLTSDRFVTGVSCVDGELWHGAAMGDAPSQLRHLASDGRVLEILDVDAPMVSGIEHIGGGRFACGGESGRVRILRKSRKKS
jgi:hypothetical protein